MKGVLRAKTDKFSDEEMPQRQYLSRRRLGRALGFLETPIDRNKAELTEKGKRRRFLALGFVLPLAIVGKRK
ncbi:MAG: hypothetical protein LBO62_01310 [Endomicrobium sp.]|jgi:hypothetical protein|nr:hypothetical protein [Endomicrobium sp.]